LGWTTFSERELQRIQVLSEDPSGGLGVYNMYRTYHTTTLYRPELINIIENIRATPGSPWSGWLPALRKVERRRLVSLIARQPRPRRPPGCRPGLKTIHSRKKLR
jgi:hypothetical protein